MCRIRPYMLFAHFAIYNSKNNTAKNYKISCRKCIFLFLWVFKMQTIISSWLLEIWLLSFGKVLEIFLISETMKLIFNCILRLQNNRKALFSTTCIIFWWIMFCIINSKINKHNIRCLYDTKLHAS